MAATDKHFTKYPKEQLLRAVVARTLSGIAMQEAARNQARMLLATPTKKSNMMDAIIDWSRDTFTSVRHQTEQYVGYHGLRQHSDAGGKDLRCGSDDQHH